MEDPQKDWEIKAERDGTLTLIDHYTGVSLSGVELDNPALASMRLGSKMESVVERIDEIRRERRKKKEG